MDENIEEIKKNAPFKRKNSLTGLEEPTEENDFFILKMLLEKIEKDLENPKKNSYLLIKEYFAAIDVYLMLMNKMYPSETMHSLKRINEKIYRTLPYKAFGHILQTNEENMSIGFFVEGLVKFGLPKKPALEHLHSWTGVSQTKIRDANILYRASDPKWFTNAENAMQKIRGKVSLNEEEYEDISHFSIMCPYEIFANEFLDKLTEAPTTHPRARPAIKKFKAFLIEMKELERLQSKLLISCKSVYRKK